MQEDWNSIGGQHFKFISLDVGKKCESEEKRKDAELELIHSNDSVVYNIPRATPREGAAFLPHGAERPREAREGGALTPVKAEKNKYKKGGPVRETTKLFCPKETPPVSPLTGRGAPLVFSAKGFVRLNSLFFIFILHFYY